MHEFKTLSFHADRWEYKNSVLGLASASWNLGRIGHDQCQFVPRLDRTILCRVCRGWEFHILGRRVQGSSAARKQDDKTQTDLKTREGRCGVFLAHKSQHPSKEGGPTLGGGGAGLVRIGSQNLASTSCFFLMSALINNGASVFFS